MVRSLVTAVMGIRRELVSEVVGCLVVRRAEGWMWAQDWGLIVGGAEYLCGATSTGAVNFLHGSEFEKTWILADPSTVVYTILKIKPCFSIFSC